MIDEQRIRSLRGYYIWGGGEDIPAPTSGRAKLRYKRFTMRELWPERNRFDWSSLDAEFDRAQRNGQHFALRLRAMTGEGIAVPDWACSLGRESVTIDTNKPIFVPNHEDPAWIEIMREFVNKVGEHCATRPDLVALVDIGMLGRWGEGHFWGIKGDGKVDGTKYWMPSVPAQQAIVDAHIEAFKDTAWLVCMTDPKDMLRYALVEAKSPRPIGWRRDSLGNEAFDNISKEKELAALLKERAKIAPVITEFFGPSGDFSAKRAREQVQRWGVWLVGNGNLGKEWKDYTPEEQAELLEIAKITPVPTPTPQPGPDSKPPSIEGAKLAEVMAQVTALQTKVDALTALLQQANLAALQTKVEGLTALLQTLDVPALHSKVEGLASSLETRTDALSALIQQPRRFVVETTVREELSKDSLIDQDAKKLATD